MTIKKTPQPQNYEDLVGGPGPVGGRTIKLDIEGPGGPGTLPVKRVLDKRTGMLVIVNRDDPLDETLYEELPGGQEGA